ncbi:unnamed protein product [Nippostrongylus brasiliensis]|uniref:C-type lectin domain-containing protein n=1 Tax=Nippostrongylus brasiliensis TaxID=27835 RepID=A0A0N4YG88_NIPBR|nr:unnamed protein product [Nippostrongylus brasiliensis]
MFCLVIFELSAMQKDFEFYRLLKLVLNANCDGDEKYWTAPDMVSSWGRFVDCSEMDVYCDSREDEITECDRLFTYHISNDVPHFFSLLKLVLNANCDGDEKYWTAPDMVSSWGRFVDCSEVDVYCDSREDEITECDRLFTYHVIWRNGVDRYD